MQGHNAFAAHTLHNQEDPRKMIQIYLITEVNDEVLYLIFIPPVIHLISLQDQKDIIYPTESH